MSAGTVSAGARDLSGGLIEVRAEERLVPAVAAGLEAAGDRAERLTLRGQRVEARPQDELQRSRRQARHLLDGRTRELLPQRVHCWILGHRAVLDHRLHV